MSGICAIYPAGKPAVNCVPQSGGCGCGSAGGEGLLALLAAILVGLFHGLLLDLMPPPAAFAPAAIAPIPAGLDTLLEALGLRERRGLDLIACPSCGRAEVDVIDVANRAMAAFAHRQLPLQIAVMGCVVNGPGEAREADLGVASGNGKGQIFVKGEVIKTVPEAQIVETLIEEALVLAEQMGVDPEAASEVSGAIVEVH